MHGLRCDCGATLAEFVRYGNKITGSVTRTGGRTFVCNVLLDMITCLLGPIVKIKVHLHQPNANANAILILDGCLGNLVRYSYLVVAMIKEISFSRSLFLSVNVPLPDVWY